MNANRVKTTAINVTIFQGDMSVFAEMATTTLLLLKHVMVSSLHSFIHTVAIYREV